MEAELTGGATVNNSDVHSDGFVKKLFMGAPIEGISDVLPILSRISAAEGTPMAPITPTPAREVRDIRVTRPVVQRRLCKTDAETQTEPECCTPRTPEQGIFDPFAPGPDDMLLAPKLRKTNGESPEQGIFDPFESSSLGECSGILGKASSHEERLLESVYCDLPDVAVPSSTEGDVAEESAQDADSDGRFNTPVLVPYMNGIPKKCPDAPMKLTKPMSKRLHMDASLCRKLEF